MVYWLYSVSFEVQYLLFVSFRYVKYSLALYTDVDDEDRVVPPEVPHWKVSTERSILLWLESPVQVDIAESAMVMFFSSYGGTRIKYTMCREDFYGKVDLFPRDFLLLAWLLAAYYLIIAGCD